MASGAQTITPKQLVILQWMSAQCSADRPEGMTRLEVIERKIRFHEFQRLDNRTNEQGLPMHPAHLAIQEEIAGNDNGIFPLTGQRAQGDEPYLKWHKNQTTLFITKSGREMARKCGLKLINTPRGPEIIVIDRSTGRPPRIESTEQSVAMLGDDDDDAVEPPPAEDAPAPREPGERDDVPPGHDLQQEVYDGLEEELTPKIDDVNEPPSRTQMAAQTTRRTAPAPTPAEPASPANTKQPKRGAARPPRKAAVPGKRE